LVGHYSAREYLLQLQKAGVCNVPERSGQELVDLIKEHFSREFAVETVREARRKLSKALGKTTQEDVPS